MDPVPGPETHDPGLPPSPYTRRPPHPPSRGTRYDRPPFLTSVEQYPRPTLTWRSGTACQTNPALEDQERRWTSRWWTTAKKNRPFPALAGEERSIQGACHLTRPEPRKGPLRGQVPGGPDSHNAGFPEAGRMTWHPYLKQDTGSSGPYRMESPRIPGTGPRDLTLGA